MRLVFFYFIICSLARGQMIPPDAQVSLDRIDPLDGKTVWTVQFDRNMRPYRCEAYTNRIVAFLYPQKAGLSVDTAKVEFLSAKTGQTIPPFDTRDFIWPDQDPQIARSGNGSQGSVEDERSEISLANGWRSHGVAGLSWRNSGSNKVYFFLRSQLQWTMTLPDGAYNLSHWNDILVFSRMTEEGNKIIDRLYAQPAGKTSTIWRFSLPSDIPDRRLVGPDVISDKIVRGLTYMVGKSHVFAFGGGTLFALDPQTGKVIWRHSVSNDPIIKKNAVTMDSAYMMEGGSSLFLTYENTLVRFDLVSTNTAAVLRKDVFDGPLPIFVDGAIYCFTQRR
jgi:hypothetical protein